jgi:hypothetical protein
MEHSGLHAQKTGEITPAFPLQLGHEGAVSAQLMSAANPRPNPKAPLPSSSAPLSLPIQLADQQQQSKVIVKIELLNGQGSQYGPQTFRWL